MKPIFSYNIDKYRHVNLLIICRMKVLLAIAAFVALANAASVSVEQLEFSAWKLKYGAFFPPSFFIYCIHNKSENGYREQ